MSKGAAITALCLMTLPTGVFGVIIYVLDDHFDSYQSVRVAQMYPEVDQQAQGLKLFLKQVVPHTLADVEMVLGLPTTSTPDSSYAMPLCQSRLVAFGGLGQRREWLHGEFYPVDSLSGLQVWYNGDSTNVARSLVYLKADSLFMPYNRDTQSSLGTRLAWDQSHLEIFKRSLQELFATSSPPNGVLQPSAPREEHR